MVKPYTPVGIATEQDIVEERELSKPETPRESARSKTSSIALGLFAGAAIAVIVT